MRRKITILLFSAMLAVLSVSCGKEVVSTNYDDMDPTEETQRDTQAKEEDPLPEATAEPEETSGRGIVLGGDFDAEYEGFSFLHCETLRSGAGEGSPDGDGSELNVFVPNNTYLTFNENYVYVCDLGVAFEIELNPYLVYDEGERSLEEELTYHINDRFDPFYAAVYGYTDVEVSDIEKTKNGVKAEVRYLFYDQWLDVYTSQMCVYYMTEVSEDCIVYVTLQIDASEITDETRLLLDELEEFYCFKIAWDADAAQSKLDRYLATADLNKRQFTTGYMLFELPRYWKPDYSYGDYSSDYFAPNGDGDQAGCVIAFSREYMGYDVFSIEEVLGSESEMNAYGDYFRSTNEGVRNVSVSAYGDTCLGPAMKITYSITREGESAECELYIATKDDCMYGVQAIVADGCSEEGVFELLEDIMLHAVVRDW